eukprot:CAMPEP_0118934236 /NCGR_PEP_ID=MMETSP1169-20130426/13714_1 /TAXON_ID=36882 /ORGANISM="Pyramimonas obovata, Strain CCMP722" /LENGTH=194 /DNA_ID=CAMNT_0006877117 /DNA_START=256 /DNA_END=840 /DNA_ORIENTATION=+
MSWRYGDATWCPKEVWALQHNYGERRTGDANGENYRSIPWEQRRWTQFSFANPISRPEKRVVKKRELYKTAPFEFVDTAPKARSGEGRKQEEHRHVEAKKGEMPTTCLKNDMISEKIGSRAYNMPERVKPCLPVDAGCGIGLPGLKTEYVSLAKSSYSSEAIALGVGKVKSSTHANSEKSNDKKQLEKLLWVTR